MLKTGASVAGFQIVGALDDEAGAGVVYEATQSDEDRPVALKVFPGGLSDRPEFRRRFREQVPRQAAIDHPAVVPIYQAGTSEEGLYLAMRLVRGPSLRDVIPAHGLDPDRAVRVLAPIAEALDTMHGEGVVHGDVKPEKILVEAGKGDGAVLAGFGIGDEDDGVGSRRESALQYISPEEIDGAPPTPRSELYSFAAILFEALTGAPPFDGRSESTVVDRHLHAPPPKASSRRAELPRALDPVLRQALAKAPSARPGSATELVSDVERALAGPRAVVRPAASRVRRPSARALGLAALAVVALAAGWLLSGRVGGPEPGERVSAGPMSLAVPAGWQRQESPPAIAGLELRDPLALMPAGGNGRAGLVAGVVAERGPVPASFLRRLRHPQAQEDILRLGGAEAYRYQRLEPPGLNRILSLYMLPTSGGVATIVCYAPSGQMASFISDCEQAATSLRLDGLTPAALGTREAYSGALDKTMRTLNARRETLRGRLAAARTADGQGAVCAQLARAYETAVDALVSPSLSAGERRANARVVAALERTSDAYGRMASAAVVGSRAEFARTGEEVDRLEGAVRAEVNQLRSLGYARGAPAQPDASLPPPA